MGQHAVEAQGLGKAYRRYSSAWRRAGEALSFGLARLHEPHWALREASFTLAGGEALGLVGANGAGKSSLLKVLARTTPPSAGRFRVRGRLASLLELGAGFHPSFTGRENVALAAQLIGLSARELRQREGAIVEFAELGAAIDEPLRTYSSGMAMRLGFAVATAIEPDVLLLDEVLAVGDLAFQRRCVDRILELKRRGAAIVFASHSLYDVRQLCERALWLERGRVAGCGESAAVTNDYAAFQREHIEHDEALRARQRGERALRPAAAPRIVEAHVVRSRDGAEVDEVESGEDVEVRVSWENPRHEREALQLGLAFLRHDRTLVAAAGTHLDGLRLEGPRGTATLRLPELALLSGSFLVMCFLFDASGVHRHQEFALERNLVVRSRTREVGLVRLPHRWVLERPAQHGEAA